LKWSHKKITVGMSPRLAVCAMLLSVLLSALMLRADLGDWLQHLPSPTQLEAAFFRAVTVPAGAIEILRPPKEAQAELSKLISATPSESSLYALRARAEEQALDPEAAENDWKRQVDTAQDKAGAALDLADFYDRRLRPKDELAALEAVAKAASPPSERFTPANQQRSWKAFARMLAAIQDQLLPADLTAHTYQSWIARYPREHEPYAAYLDFLVAQKEFREAGGLIADYRKAFPDDAVYPVQAAASLAGKQGSPDDALRVYDASFQPLWPPSLVQSYFALLKANHGLRRFLEQARAQAAQRPTDLNAAARLFYYYQQSGNLPAAQRALLEFRQHKEAAKSPWTAVELKTLAELFAGALNYDEAARHYYAMYSVSGADAASQEAALASLAQLLLDAPDSAVHFAAGDLSLYRDIGTIDRDPGFLNGVLSLLLNSTEPAYRYNAEDQASLPYFHRAKAAELAALFNSRFPQSSRRPALESRLISAYATYGDNDGVIRAGKAFLTAFPQAEERSAVALQMADAYARAQGSGPPNAEFAIYDDLLKELAAKTEGSRSPQYVLVLDRYISRLVALKRPQDALVLYRREIDRNPNDPGLYERLAAFLEQNKMSADLEQTYRKAMAQFPDGDWSHKLARWYIRQKQNAQFEQLTRDVVKIFSGTAMEAYVRDVGTGQPLSPVLYRQVNLYAHQRFPHDLVFVDNLLNAYAQKATFDAAASEALLRRYWSYSPGLRNRFFELLSSTKRLDAELVSLNAAQVNPGIQTMRAEAQAWQSHFEAAAPLFQALVTQYPADNALDTRAATLYRSLATYDAAGELKNTRVAAAIGENLTKYDPRDEKALTMTGEIYADRELFDPAGRQWNRIAEVHPGVADGYVRTATIYWDYFRYDDALRLLAQGRQQLQQPALFAYETGAIYEDRREYRRAVEEYAKGAWSQDGALARSRLIQLARRPRDRDLIEEVTANAVAGTDPAPGAVSLRVDVLVAQNRRPGLQAFLLGLADRTTSPDLLTYLQDTGRAQGFEAVEEHALLRQAALATDPLEKIQNRLALARFYEGHNNSEAATRTIASVYKDNPAVLGVVRATVDYYWRNKNTQAAIDTLQQASAAASPDFRKQFTFEAARKATDAGEQDRARTLLAGLRKDDPYNAEYIAAVADTYGRQGDNRGLRDFYTVELDALAKAHIPQSERVEKIAGLRRGLIPVLTRLNDFAGAMDQYIEILNRYPEDEDLTREAALYAQAHNRGQQLAGYYEKTASASPKDYRWPMLLARIQTYLEDFPAAIAAYNRATQIRPERVDLYTARAALEERTLRFDEAAATYTKLYELNYHNTVWMEKLAAVRASQGQTDAVIQALRKAMLDGRPDRAENYFSVAGRLESWGLLAPAREYAEKGVGLAGGRLLVENASGAFVYARIMARLRAYPEAIHRIQSAAPKNADQPSEIDAVMRQIGGVVAQYYTPEEKSQFAAFLLAGPPQQNLQRARGFLSLADSAGLLDVQVKWMYDLQAADPGPPLEPVERLQDQRLLYAEFAGQLERYWKVFPADKDGRDNLLVQAASKYRLAGETASELRILTQLDQLGVLNSALVPRYASLLNARTPQRLNVLAASDKAQSVRDEIATYGIQELNATRALALIAARGNGLPPVWTKAYTGLVGLYLSSSAPAVASSFRDALAVGSIGDRLAKKPDRTAQLVGEIWFPYGTHYGEYEQLMKQPDADDYLPALLEASPASAEAYFRLAELYREAGRLPQAAADYHNTLQLNSRRGDADDRLAMIAIEEKKRDEAVRYWSSALQSFGWQQDQSKAPPEFWENVRAALVHIGKNNALGAVRPDADKLLRTYIRRNGSWQADLLMQGALAAASDPAAGVAWILDLSRTATDRASFLKWLARADWLPEPQRPQVYQAGIDAAGAVLAATYGDAHVSAENELRTLQVEFSEYLINHGRATDAALILAGLPDDYRKDHLGQVAPLAIRIAAQQRTLSSLLDRYRLDSAAAPPADDLLRVANELSLKGDPAASRQVLEYLYTRQLAARDFSVANFLGLAEIRLDQNDVPAAVTLLRRMTRVLGEPFDNLADAGSLLLRKGRPAEAVEFLSARVKAQPWDQSSQELLGQAASDTSLLQTVAGSNSAPYPVRVNAARQLRELKAPPLKTSSVELNLLSAGSIVPTEAEKPYYYAARMDAATQATDPVVKLRLLRGAVAIDSSHPDDKIQIFHLAYSAKRYQTAVAALHPLAPPGLEDSSPWGTPNFSSDLARQLADAYVNLGQPQPAIYLYKFAADPQSEPALRQLLAQAELQAQNNRRRPIISAKLEQDHLILPRLKSGGAQ
jgi:cellulose synthase operon protein C